MRPERPDREPPHQPGDIGTEAEQALQQPPQLEQAKSTGQHMADAQAPVIQDANVRQPAATAAEGLGSDKSQAQRGSATLANQQSSVSAQRSTDKPEASKCITDSHAHNQHATAAGEYLQNILEAKPSGPFAVQGSSDSLKPENGSADSKCQLAGAGSGAAEAAADAADCMEPPTSTLQPTANACAEVAAATVMAGEHATADMQAIRGAEPLETQADLPLASESTHKPQQQQKEETEAGLKPNCVSLDNNTANTFAAKLDQAVDKPVPSGPLCIANKQATATATVDNFPAVCIKHSLSKHSSPLVAPDTQTDKENSPSVASEIHTDSQNSLQSLTEQQHSRAATAAAAAVVAEAIEQQPPTIRPRPRLRRQPKIDKDQDSGASAMPARIPMLPNHEVTPPFNLGCA